jgi:hypothetical protein
MNYVSPFGVEHVDISKAANTKKASPGRLATAGLFSPVHGVVAGKKGKKLRAGGNEFGGTLLGGIAGGTVAVIARKPGAFHPLSAAGGTGGAVMGAMRAQKKGYFKPEK